MKSSENFGYDEEGNFDKTLEMKDLELQARKKSIEIYKGEHGNSRPNFWVCGNILLPNGAKTNCYHCQKVCYYDTKLRFQFTKDVKKICVRCAYEKFPENMTALEKEIIERILENEK